MPIAIAPQLLARAHKPALAEARLLAEPVLEPTLWATMPMPQALRPWPLAVAMEQAEAAQTPPELKQSPLAVTALPPEPIPSQLVVQREPHPVLAPAPVQAMP